jgi:hypothetical protein
MFKALRAAGTAFLIISLMLTAALGQSAKPPTYVDAKGLFRWTKDKKPVYLFGVNYTLPFAYGYRAVKALKLNHEQEIDKDVYHLARLGIDAFRVHVWDTEISDSLGNLKQNEHLRLFDYLVSKLEQRGIRIIITPIAFWGNGYPEPDEHTGSFSDKYGKNGALVNEQAFKAQERYLQQFFSHVNPYTHKTYTADDFVIATEINNEPHPSGPKTRATEYINRMKAAINSTGWNKPIFYNISESPWYADAVAKSEVDGFSFQWYPIGLVAGHEQKGNMLPNVDRYTYPYDTIPEFKNKARMIYEFDAADMLSSYMYPAIARSFKQAGFQWVTQFAYDPLSTAYGNTEYQTHYLNLAYTPAKAISLLIANRAFHTLPADKKYGTYPLDSIFDTFRVSYKQSLSEMNTEKEFYYSGSTTTSPRNSKALQHIAGVGNSVVVNYSGYGAYFLDKLESGIWRLEVMPDAITVRDPFAKPSPAREAVHIAWNNQPMQIALNDLGSDFKVQPINTQNNYTTTARQNKFAIKPGTYLLTKQGKNSRHWTDNRIMGYLKLNEFVAPQPVSHDLYIAHTPVIEVSSGKPITVNIKAINIDSADKVLLMVKWPYSSTNRIAMTRVTPNDYTAAIPPDGSANGKISYRVVVQHGEGDYIVFPGGHQGNPNRWDDLNDDYWQTFVAAPHGNISLFNATTDQDKTNTYVPETANRAKIQWVGGSVTGQLALRMSTPALQQNQILGMQLYIGSKLNNRMSDLSGVTKLIIKARTTSTSTAKLRVVLIDQNAAAYTTSIEVSADFKTIEIPLNGLQPDSSLLLPRPYPGFMPLWFKASSFTGFKLPEADKLEITFNSDLNMEHLGKAAGIEIESVWLEK